MVAISETLLATVDLTMEQAWQAIDAIAIAFSNGKVSEMLQLRWLTVQLTGLSALGESASSPAMPGAHLLRPGMSDDWLATTAETVACYNQYHRGVRTEWSGNSDVKSPVSSVIVVRVTSVV